MPNPFDPAKMGNALRNFFTPKPAAQAAPQQPGPVSFEDALKSLGPAMDNGQAYTNPNAVRDYQSAARGVAAMYGMQPNGYFLNASPRAFQPTPGVTRQQAQNMLGTQPAPNPTVR